MEEMRRNDTVNCFLCDKYTCSLPVLEIFLSGSWVLTYSSDYPFNFLRGYPERHPASVLCGVMFLPLQIRDPMVLSRIV